MAVSASKTIRKNLARLDKNGSLRLEAKDASNLITIGEVCNTTNVGLNAPAVVLPIGLDQPNITAAACSNVSRQGNAQFESISWRNRERQRQVF